MSLLEQLQQLAPLAAAATAGPWRIELDQEDQDVPMLLSEYGHVANIEEGLGWTGDQQQAEATAAFIAAARNLLTPENLALLVAALAPQWVAAKDRLPEAGWNRQLSNPVLVYGLGTVSCIRHYEPGAEVWYDAAHGVSEPRRHYSHWMPLPSTPTTPAK